MPHEQRIRAALFYLSLFVFFAGLPFILSFALGYKFNPHTLRFTKTGLVVLKTQPAGADVYLNNRLLGARTPSTIAELLPGRYTIRLELENHYPWSIELEVRAGTVNRLEKIILFALRPNIKHMNNEYMSSFWADPEKGTIYYVNPQDNTIYKSDLEGKYSQRVASFIDIHPPPLKWKVSPDREKVLYFNSHQLGIAYLESAKGSSLERQPFIINYAKAKINDVFWHSDSYHLVLVSERSIEAAEARPHAEFIFLAGLNKKESLCQYDLDNDTLYFMDTQKASDGTLYDNLYRLELNARTFPLGELIGLKYDE